MWFRFAVSRVRKAPPAWKLSGSLLASNPSILAFSGSKGHTDVLRQYRSFLCTPHTIAECRLPLYRYYSQVMAVEIQPEIADLPIPDPKFAEIILGIPRECSGKSNAHKERKAGRVPSIVYSREEGQKGGNKQLISVETKQISRLLKRMGRSFFLSRTFELEIRPTFEAEEVMSSERVLPQSVHLHAGTDEILNVTFIRAPPSVVLNVHVPIVFRGEDACPGIRKGGYLNTIKRAVEFLCPADHIPPYVEVDLSNMEVGQRVLMCDLKVHPSCELRQRNNTLPVCKVMGSRALEEVPTATS